MPQLTENQIAYIKSNQKDFDPVAPEKQEALLKKSATRWFKEMADFYSNRSDSLSEEEQEDLDKLIGTGIFFAYQFKKIGEADYVDTVRELLTEYTDLESKDIGEAIKNYDTLTAPRQEAPEEEAPEEEAPAVQEPEPQPVPRRTGAKKERENTAFDVELFDYLRARNHFEKRNPVSRFFSKLAGKIFRTGEYFNLSVKENYLQNQYGLPKDALDREYGNINQKNTLDKFSTEAVDYNSMSATDKEVNEFMEKLQEDFKPEKSEKAPKQAETAQPTVTKQLE